MQEQRQSVRVNVEFQCLVLIGSQEYVGRVSNLSIGGARIQLSGIENLETVAIGTHCTVNLATQWGQIETKSEIQRVINEAPLVIAVMFHDLSDEARRVFQSLVSDLVKENLVQASNMTSLARMLAGLNHEIKSPLAVVITGVTHLLTLAADLQGHYEDNTLKKKHLSDYFDDTRETQQIIVENTARVGEIIDSFKMVSVDQATARPRAFELPGYLHDILRTLKVRIVKTAHTVKIVHHGKIDVTGFPGAFVQVMTNLLNNAFIHAFEPGQAGTVCIETDTEDDGETVVVRFSDNGSGIPPEVQPHIFSPFYTTKAESGGTGLGLNIVRTLVKDTFGGTVACESVVGEGTTFTVRFPRVAPEVDEGEDAGQITSAWWQRMLE
jgi:signal transduction histidine kinase